METMHDRSCKRRTGQIRRIMRSNAVTTAEQLNKTSLSPALLGPGNYSEMQFKRDGRRSPRRRGGLSRDTPGGFFAG